MTVKHNSWLPAWQSNLQKKVTSSASLYRDLLNAPDTLAFVQEPKVFGKRIGYVPSSHLAFSGSSKEACRAALFIPKSLAPTCFILKEWSSRDLIAVRCTQLYKDTPVVFVSHYMDGNFSSSVSKDLNSVVDYCNQEGFPLVIGCDSNSHSVAWGGKDCNRRGIEFEEFLACKGLSWAKIGNAPTYTRCNASSLIDLTVVNNKAYSLVYDWKHWSTTSLSDHVRLEFKLDLLRPLPRSFRDTKKCNWNTYREVLKFLLLEHPFRYTPNPSLAQLNSAPGHIEWCMLKAFEAACPLKYKSSTKHNTWWSPELTLLRSKVRAAKRQEEC